MGSRAGGAAGPPIEILSSASSQGADAVRDGAVGPERFLRAGRYSLEVAAAAILAPVGLCGLRRRDGEVRERGEVRRMRRRAHRLMPPGATYEGQGEDHRRESENQFEAD